MTTRGERRIAVVVVAAEAQRGCAQAVLEGLEEEGVPARVDPSDPRMVDARGLAAAGAERAAHEVGVGIDADGVVSLRHARVPPDHLGAPCKLDRASLRVLGHNAGRLVKRLSLHQMIQPVDTHKETS